MYSIKKRLLLGMACILLLALLPAGLYAIHTLRAEAENDARATALNVLRGVEWALAQHAPFKEYRELNEWANGYEVATGVRVSYIVDGALAADSQLDYAKLPETADHSTRPEVLAAQRGETSVDARFSTTVGKRYIYAALFTNKIPGAKAGVLRIAMPDFEVSGRLSGLERDLALIFALAFLAGCALVGILLLAVFRYLAGLTRSATEIGQGNYARRMPDTRCRELQPFVVALNGMAANIEQQISLIRAEKSQLETVLNAMHEGVLLLDAHERIVRANPAAAGLFPGMSPIDGKLLMEVIMNNALREAVAESGAAKNGQTQNETPPCENMADEHAQAAPKANADACAGLPANSQSLVISAANGKTYAVAVVSLPEDLSFDLPGIPGGMPGKLPGALPGKRPGELPDALPGKRPGGMPPALSKGRLQGGPARTMLVITDISERERVDAIRRDFVANVSHELRTPLTNIRGYAELMQDTPTLPEYKRMEFLGIIARNAAHMSRMTDSLLTLARAEHANARPRLESADLADALQATAREFAPQLAEKGVRLELRIPQGISPGMSQNASPGTPQDAQPGVPPAPLLVRGDADSLHEVFFNLLDNAIKYGGGRVEASITPRNANGMAQVDVRDYGAGIPEAGRERIFERFYRLERPSGEEKRKTSGSVGLGLAICRHIVHNLGGSIQALAPTDGGPGSLFTVCLPLAPQEDRPL